MYNNDTFIYKKLTKNIKEQSSAVLPGGANNYVENMDRLADCFDSPQERFWRNCTLNLEECIIVTISDLYAFFARLGSKVHINQVTEELTISDNDIYGYVLVSPHDIISDFIRIRGSRWFKGVLVTGGNDLDEPIRRYMVRLRDKMKTQAFPVNTLHYVWFNGEGCVEI